MTAVATAPVTETASRFRPHEIWRIVRLHTVNPSIFFGVPWIILGGAWAVTMVIALILRSAGISDAEDGFRYSWAVLSPQWYLIVVGVQALAYTSRSRSASAPPAATSGSAPRRCSCSSRSRWRRRSRRSCSSRS